MENGRVMEPGDPYYICKHCDAACAELDDENGIAYPSGVLLSQPPICDGCDWYEKDCECEDSIHDRHRDEDLARGESDYEDCL